MTKHSLAKIGILSTAILTIPALCLAGTAAPGKETKAVKESIKESCITGDLGINIVSQYASRGVIFENQSAILQPYADLYFKLYEGTGFFNKISLNLGIWNSFHSRKTDAGAVFGGGGSTTNSWYEFDFTAGVAFTFAKNFTFTPSYYMFLSPNDGFSTFEGLNLALTYDDTDLLGKFALHPHVTVMFELQNKAGTGKEEGVYYEVGIAPSVPAGPVTFTFPITAGFGSGDFYGSLNTAKGTLDNEAFGYVSAGVTASYAMKFVPECYGAWTATAGYTYYYLGEGTSDFNTAPRGGAVRDENHNEHIFSGGLSVAF
ncbi:MAG: hypothetical protein K8R23_07140 [Chthoniobacter sp.]|nr:hypothetical protein [Chthoniobacter sp.]